MTENASTATEAQVEVFDESAQAWLVFDDAADAESYGLTGDEDLIADVVPLAEDEEPPTI